MKTISVIGLGNRGTGYMRHVRTFHKGKVKIIAVCDIRQQALDDIAPAYGVPEAMRFLCTDDFFAQGVISDALFICTQDASHFEIAKQAILTGYKYILLEKPVSKSVEECKELQKLSEAHGTTLVVCHVLRYSNYFGKIKEIIRSGAIGDVLYINHTENVGYFHFAHSYVRGNWKREEDSTPSILAKCCHDLDLIQWYADSECVSVDSDGGIFYFNSAHAPQGATKKCLQGCAAKATCPYNAENLYIKDPVWRAKFIKYMRRTLTGKSKNTRADIRNAIENGPYGDCVYLNNNTVCDIQTVNMTFKNGVRAILTMNALSDKMFRECHIVGTKGELIGYNHSLKLKVFGGKSKKVHIGGIKFGGHVEGDIRLIAKFVKLINGELEDTRDLTTIAATIPSHEISARAEIARKSK